MRGIYVSLDREKIKWRSLLWS